MKGHKTLSGVSIQDYYGQRFQKFGGDVRTLWNSQQSQVGRFHVLTEIGDLSGSRILDVGCGFGDFQEYLRAQNIWVDYTGIDIQPDILAEAQHKHPEVNFEQVDLMDCSPLTKFDYVFASGIFALKMTNQQEYVQAILSRMFALANKGVAVNFLSTYTTGNLDQDSFHVAPQDILSLALSITRRVVLRHDYRDNDFSLYLYPHDRSL